MVRKYVIFEDGISFQRSLESRFSIEDETKAHIDVLEGAQPQVYSTLVSG
jgi:hypothetical protein